MNNFLVLGLPRSRTAWLANFLTYGDITCTHEGLNGCRTLEDYKNKFTPYSGDSNTGLALFDFEALFSDFKLVIIDNGISAAVDFTQHHFKHDSTVLMTLLDKRLTELNGLHIAFADIDSQLETIWNYVAPTPFSADRAALLKKFDIQVKDIDDFDEPAMHSLKQNTPHYFPIEESL